MSSSGVFNAILNSALTLVNWNKSYSLSFQRFFTEVQKIKFVYDILCWLKEQLNSYINHKLFYGR